jgi:hypothetical protein
MVAVTDLAGPERSAQYMGAYLTLAGVRGVAGPLLGAFLIQRGGLPQVYGLAAGVMLLAAGAAARQAAPRGPASTSLPAARVAERAAAV